MNFNLQIENAVRILNEDSSHTFAEVARRCGLSISRLSHVFQAETGMSLGKFRRNCRLDKAKKMLATTDMSVKQIAYTLGYRHSSSFVRVFERCVGMSPSDYKESELKNNLSASSANKQQERLTAFD